MSRRSAYLGFAIGCVTLLVVAFLVRGSEQEPTIEAATIETLAESARLQPQGKETTVKFDDPIVDAYYDALLSGCEAPTVEPLNEEQIQEKSQKLKAEVMNLQASNAANLLHVVGLVDRDSARSMANINKALALTPNDPFLLYTAARLCINSENEACNSETLVNDLVNLDSESSEAWTQLALLEYRNGRPEQAISALTRASVAAEVGDYWIDYVLLTLDAVEAVGTYDYAESVEIAFGVSAAFAFPSYQSRFTMCKELAKSSENAALACLQLGQQMETRGKGLLTLALGSGLQKVMLENLGRTEELTRLEQRHAARNQRFTNGANWYNQVKLRHSPTTFQHFVATYRDGGELYAIDAYSKAISSVLAVNPELACAEPVQF